MEEKAAQIVSRETLEVLSTKDHLQPRKASRPRPKRRGKRKRSVEKETVFWRNFTISLILFVLGVIIALLVAILSVIRK